MKFKTLKGYERDVSIKRYLTKWPRVISKPQKLVKDFFYPYWHHHIVLEEFRIPSTKLRTDLLNLTTHWLVEISPVWHRTSGHYFFNHSLNNFVNSTKRDMDKERWAEINGYKFIEIWEEDIPNLGPKWFKDKYNLDL